MLREEWLFRLSFFVGVLGVLLIGIYSFYAEPMQLRVNEVTELLVDETVLLEGRVDKSYFAKGVLIFELNDGSGKIKCVKLNPEGEDFRAVRKNAFLKVKGRVGVYKGELEILVDGVESA